MSLGFCALRIAWSWSKSGVPQEFWPLWCSSACWLSVRVKDLRGVAVEVLEVVEDPRVAERGRVHEVLDLLRGVGLLGQGRVPGLAALLEGGQQFGAGHLAALCLAGVDLAPGLVVDPLRVRVGAHERPAAAVVLPDDRAQRSRERVHPGGVDAVHEVAVGVVRDEPARVEGLRLLRDIFQCRR
jgi:hypothetical protein